jgi:hypothetical protein
MDSYENGQPARIAGNIKVGGVDTDPTTLTFRITEPDGTVTTYVYLTDVALVKDSVGDYHVDWAVDQIGVHYYEFVGTGTAALTLRGSFLSMESSAPAVAGIVILTKVADWDSIRGLIGITSSDVTDAELINLPFLPVAEAVIIEAVPTYAALTGSNKVYMRMATAQYCAALLCQRMANQQRARERAGEYVSGDMDWAEMQASCFSACYSYLDRISTYTTTTVSPMRAAGVHRHAQAHRDNNDFDTKDFKND